MSCRTIPPGMEPVGVIPFLTAFSEYSMLTPFYGYFGRVSFKSYGGLGISKKGLKKFVIVAFLSK